MRWSNLPSDTKRALRDRDEFRKKRMVEQVEAALQEGGLALDKTRRGKFTKRYVEERRKIEEQLRTETEAKRVPLVKEMVARLKDEFSAPVPPP